MNGLLLVDKPPGITSHDVVARVRRALGERRVGHAGTLDPAATGLLVVGVGSATRLLRFLEAHDKEYVADCVFGVDTSTQDAQGEVTARTDASALDETALAAALPRFTGTIEQVPPMASAIKVGGVRLHTLARQGREVERAARRVTVHTLVLRGFEPGQAARAQLFVRCSKGTYVRTLAADIGAALGVGGHVAGLRRTRIGPFAVEDAVEVDAVTADALQPIEVAVEGYPRRPVGEDEVRALIHGKPLAAAGISGPYAVVGPRGLVAMAEDKGEEARSLCVLVRT